MSQHGDQGRGRGPGGEPDPGRETQPAFLPPPGQARDPREPGAPWEPKEQAAPQEPREPGGYGPQWQPGEPGAPGAQWQPGEPGGSGGPGRLPVEPPPPPVFGAPARVLNTATVVAAAALMVSAFLPWVSGTEVITGFGQVVHRSLGTASGVDVDGTGQLVPVLALMAIGMCLWGAFARNPRICTLAAVPGGLALLACVIFLVRLGGAQDDLAEGEDGLGYEITLGYGWFVALATALLVIGTSLAAPIIARAQQPPPSGVGQS